MYGVTAESLTNKLILEASKTCSCNAHGHVTSFVEDWRTDWAKAVSKRWDENERWWTETRWKKLGIVWLRVRNPAWKDLVLWEVAKGREYDKMWYRGYFVGLVFVDENEPERNTHASAKNTWERGIGRHHCWSSVSTIFPECLSLLPVFIMVMLFGFGTVIMTILARHL